MTYPITTVVNHTIASDGLIRLGVRNDDET